MTRFKSQPPPDRFKSYASQAAKEKEKMMMMMKKMKKMKISKDEILAVKVLAKLLPRQCTNCLTTSSSQWRGGMCNACKLYMDKNGTPRPEGLFQSKK